MHNLELSDDLQSKITRYYEYLWMHNETVLFGHVSVYNDPVTHGPPYERDGHTWTPL